MKGNVNPIVIDANADDMVRAVYESGYASGRFDGVGKGYWRGWKWGIISVAAGWCAYKLISRILIDDDSKVEEANESLNDYIQTGIDQMIADSIEKAKEK